MGTREDRQSSISAALRQKDEDVMRVNPLKLVYLFIQISRLRQQHKLELQTVIDGMSSNTSETHISDLLLQMKNTNFILIETNRAE